MSYYDFPHTRDYDNDLGFLIKRYKDLMHIYNDLLDVYKQVKNNIQDTVLNMFLNNEIKLDALYNEDDESITFIFINNKE